MTGLLNPKLSEIIGHSFRMILGGVYLGDGIFHSVVCSSYIRIFLSKSVFWERGLELPK